MATRNLSENYLPMGQVGNYQPQTRRPFQPGRPVSVGEWKQNWENNPMARYADGRPVPVGTKVNMPMFNTSGLGPGSRGYRGSGGTFGYSFQHQGNAASKLADYAPHFGGLNEFYRMQQGMSDWDRLQGKAAMDRSDAIGSQLGQMARSAMMRGDLETAEAFSMALEERLAQRMAANGGGGGFGMEMPMVPSDPFAGRTTVGARPMSTDIDPNSAFAQNLLNQAAQSARNRSGMIATDVGQFQTPFGRASIGPASIGSTFTNAQGSFGPGGTATNYGGVQSGSQFFQDAANRQRTGNVFAQPQSGFNGQPASDLDAYSQRLLAAKQRLGKA